MSVIKSNTCSKCGLFSDLAPSNISRKTGERLYRSWCISCEKERKAKWVQENMERLLQKTQVYQQARPEMVKQSKAKWLAEHPNYMREYRRIWREQNRDVVRASVSARRHRVRKNTPPWANKKELLEFYKNCPTGFHVDHIIPLKGKLVSGLHVVTNLQYLPAKENMTKGNKYAPDC